MGWLGAVASIFVEEACGALNFLAVFVCAAKRKAIGQKLL